MICDLQGVINKFTDPIILTNDKNDNENNCDTKRFGMGAFLIKHTVPTGNENSLCLCKNNEYCAKLGLGEREGKNLFCFTEDSANEIIEYYGKRELEVKLKKIELYKSVTKEFFNKS